MSAEEIATDISARPAMLLQNGFQLLALRQFTRAAAPPAFAFIDQSILRRPDRVSRHGASFDIAFLPEIMAWLIEAAGAPTRRNPRWPVTSWRAAERLWPDGAATIEWCAEIIFLEIEMWRVFAETWRERLQGGAD